LPAAQDATNLAQNQACCAGAAITKGIAMRRGRLVTGAARARAAAAALVVAICGLTAQAQAQVHVRVGKAQAQNFAFLPADVGLAAGIFRKHAIDLEIANFGGDARLVQAISADAIDFALGGGPTIRSRSRARRCSRWRRWPIGPAPS
jgi:hypothetical protein